MVTGGFCAVIFLRCSTGRQVQGEAFSLNVSTCPWTYSDTGDIVEIFTCSGGTYCDIDTESDSPKWAGTFEELGTWTEITINVDVEPTTLVLIKPSGTNAWCAVG